MASKLYVGNLNYDTTEDTLREVFEKHGTVESVNIITDRQTGRSRGFAFVEMSSEEEAKSALKKLNGTEVDDRTLKVDEARPRRNRSGSGPRSNF